MMPAGKEPQFTKLAELALTRREALMSTAAFIIGTATFLPSQGLAAGRHDFTAVAANTLDTVTVPKGFSWHVVASWGDPLWSDGEAFDHESRGTGASQERAFGDNNDGMELFRSGNRNILAVNNEFVNLGVLYGNRSMARPYVPTTSERVKRLRRQCDRNRRARRQMGCGFGFPIQPPYYSRYACGGHRPRPGSCLAKNRSGPRRHTCSRHLQQLW